MPLPTHCPLCRAGIDSQSVVTSHVFGREGGEHAFFNCISCGVRYQYPTLSPEEESRFYAAEFENFMSSRSGFDGGWHRAEEHIASNELTRKRRMQYLKPYLIDKCKILEIGCSSGFMLLPLAEKGYSCSGIEPSGIFRDFVNNKGLRVYESFEELKSEPLGEKLDLIIHFFVLEHIINPFDFLKSQLDLLKPGGKIIFEIPNAADPLFELYDIPAFERFYWSVAHPWYFNESSIIYLLKKLGSNFNVLREQRYDWSNHMIWARDGKPGGMGRFTNVLGEEFDQNYKKTLIKSGFCDTLVVIINID